MTDLNLTPFFDRLSELRTALVCYFFSVLDIQMSDVPDVVIKDLLSAISCLNASFIRQLTAALSLHSRRRVDVYISEMPDLSSPNFIK
jgi:hypothetical protein